MSEIDFAAGQWWPVLSVPVVYLVWSLVSYWLQVRRLSRVAEVPQLARLLPASLPRRRVWASIAMAGALLLASLAVLRPRYGSEPVEEFQGGVDVCIALDLSNSMYAQDIAPNRLERARSEIDEFLQKMRSGRVCAVAFAGTADVYPLTTDRDAIRFYLKDLTPEDMPTGGTALAKAIEGAHKALIADDKKLQEQGLLRPPKVLFLITDGEDTTGGDTSKALESAKNAGITIFALGVGGVSPEPIPDIENGKMIGYKKNGEARTALDEAMLRKFTQETGGRYVSLSEGALEIQSELRTMGEGFIEMQVRQSKAERYNILLIGACLLWVLHIAVTRYPSLIDIKRTTKKI